MTKIINVSAIYENRKKDGNVFYTIQDTTGGKYNIFDYDLIASVQAGGMKVNQSYEVTLGARGRWVYITSYQSSGSTPSTAAPLPPYDNPTTNLPATEPPSTYNLPATQTPSINKSYQSKDQLRDMKDSEKNECIIKESALKSSVEMHGVIPFESWDIEDIITTAKRFEKYIKEGD